MNDGTNVVLDPHVVAAIALVALAVVVALLVICAGVDERRR